MTTSRLVAGLTIALSAGALGACAVGGEGFGTLPKVVKMRRTEPPQYFLPVSAYVLELKGPGDAAPLRRRIETLVREGDPGLKQRGDAPFKLRVVLRSYLAGNTHSIEGEWRLADGHDRELGYGSVNSSNAGALVKESDGQLIDSAAYEVARVIAAQYHDSNVLLPRGSLESLRPLAERGDWQAYLDAAQSMPARSGPGEAYRQYAIAVAMEALAYRAGDPRAIVPRLREALAHNEQAARLAPGEKLFTEPFMPVYHPFRSPGNPPRVWVSADDLKRWETWALVRVWLDAVPAAGLPLDNAGVLAMVRETRSEAEIIAAIAAAKRTAFDFSEVAQIGLAQAGAGWEVVNAMKKKQGWRGFGQ